MAEPNSIHYRHSSTDDETKPVLYMKKQIFFMPGVKISIYDGAERLLAKAYGLPFRLREKINIYSDEAMQHKVLVSSTTKILDWNVVFVLKLASSDAVIGSFRRRGWSSEFVRDSWLLFDKNGEQVAELLEDSVKMGLIRRFVIGRLPQTYHLKTSGGRTLTLKQSWNPVLLRYRGYSTDWKAIVKELSEPLLIGALSTIAIIEGRQ